MRIRIRNSPGSYDFLSGDDAFFKRTPPVGLGAGQKGIRKEGALQTPNESTTSPAVVCHGLGIARKKLSLISSSSDESPNNNDVRTKAPSQKANAKRHGDRLRVCQKTPVQKRKQLINDRLGHKIQTNFDQLEQYVQKLKEDSRRRRQNKSQLVAQAAVSAPKQSSKLSVGTMVVEMSDIDDDD